MSVWSIETMVTSVPSSNVSYLTSRSGRSLNGDDGSVGFASGSSRLRCSKGMTICPRSSSIPSIHARVSAGSDSSAIFASVEFFRRLYSSFQRSLYCASPALMAAAAAARSAP